MALDTVLARFVAECPVAVMARLALQRAISSDWVDAVFEEHRQRQYTRELLFSTVVDLMGLVALGMRPSLHAAAQRAMATGELSVSLPALYEKVNHTAPAVLRALVQGSAARLAPVSTRLQPATTAVSALPGYRLRIVDGNHLPASEKRAKPLRGVRSAALPGQALVVYDPTTGLVVDLCPGEDAHACERSFLPPLLEHAGPGDLWIGDRHFATRGIIGALTERGAAVLVREGGAHPRPTASGPRRRIGRSETGMVYEQTVEIPLPLPAMPASGPSVLRLRRIEVELDDPTEDGETVIRLLTTLPATDADAITVAALYRKRWTIEGMFQRLEAVLQSEVRPLGQPRAALLAFSIAVVAYNVLAVVETAVEAEAVERAQADSSANTEPVPISMYYVAQEVREYYRGLLVAVDPAVWEHYDSQGPAALALTLQRMAAHVRLEALRKHPRKPTSKRKPGYAPRSDVQRHVATARLLAEQKSAKPKRSRRTP